LAWHVACMGDRRGAYRVLLGRAVGKRPLARHNRRKKNNIKMDIPEMWWEDMDWIDLTEDRDDFKCGITFYYIAEMCF